MEAEGGGGSVTNIISVLTFVRNKRAQWTLFCKLENTTLEDYLLFS